MNNDLTAQDIEDYFRSQGINIGAATIYRRLDRLTTDGLVNKYIIDEKSPACYEFIGTEHCSQGKCYHMKCEQCGKRFTTYEVVETLPIIVIKKDGKRETCQKNTALCLILKERFSMGSATNAITAIPDIRAYLHAW